MSSFYDYAEAWNEKDKVFQRVDVQKLIILTKNRIPIWVPIKEIWGGDENSSGFSEERLLNTDIKYSILVDAYFEGLQYKYGLVDGRHRKIKRIRLGLNFAPIVILTYRDIISSLAF